MRNGAHHRSDRVSLFPARTNVFRSSQWVPTCGSETGEQLDNCSLVDYLKINQPFTSPLFRQGSMIYLGLAWGLLLVCLCPCTGYESKA